jgi:DNA-binding FadR family transcriptional regulator
MQDENTLFSEVYDDLKSRILNGQFPTGSTFLSIQRLRDEYRIGYRTAREITRRLQADNLIEVQPRKAPVVKHPFAAAANDEIVFKLLSEKDSILDVYDVVTCLLGPLLTFAIPKSNLEFLPHYKQAARITCHSRKPDDWRNIFLLCQEILHSSGNPLICDLYTSLARYGCLSGLFENSNTQLCDLLNETGHFIDILTLQDSREKCSLLTISFKSFADAVSESLKLLESQYPKTARAPKEIFRWNTSYSYIPSYRYTDIMSDLIIKITSGFYPRGSYLPHEAVLAAEYGVCLSTLRKALHELQELGYCKTFNVKGTIVLNPDDEYLMPAYILHNTTYKKKIFLYLYSVQFMSLIIGPASQKAMLNFTKEDMELITKKTNTNDTDIIKTIVDIIILRQPSEAMQIILKKTQEMLQWSYYFSFHTNDKKHLQIMYEQKEKICRTFKDNDKEQFAYALSSYYCRLLDVSRSYFVDSCQLGKAADIYTPKIY